MKNTSSPAFRSSMSGFNKKDVNEYIAALCREYEAASAECESENERLKAEVSELTAKLEELSAALEAKIAENLEGKLDEANKVITAQTEQIDALKETNEKLTGELAEATKKLEAYIEMDSKMDKYETMTARMGEIYMEATADAERIRAEAKTDADTIIADAKTESKRRLAKYEEHLGEFADARKGELTRLFNETQSGINRVLASFAEKSRFIVNKPINVTIDEFEPVHTNGKDA